MGKRGSHMVRKAKDNTTLEAETVGYMPERFTTAYNELVRLGLKTDPGAQTFDNESGTIKKKFHEHAGGLKDEQALRFKAWVDRQLRAIGRDVQSYLNARDGSGPSPIGMSPTLRREVARELESKTELKCKNPMCGKYISWQWTHCAWCGRKIDGSTGNDVEASSEAQSEITVGVLQLSSGPTGQDVDREDGRQAGRDDDSASGDDSSTRP